MSPFTTPEARTLGSGGLSTASAAFSSIFTSLSVRWISFKKFQEPNEIQRKRGKKIQETTGVFFPVSLATIQKNACLRLGLLHRPLGRCEGARGRHGRRRRRCRRCRSGLVGGTFWWGRGILMRPKICFQIFNCWIVEVTFPKSIHHGTLKWVSFENGEHLFSHITMDHDGHFWSANIASRS